MMVRIQTRRAEGEWRPELFLSGSPRTPRPAARGDRPAGITLTEILIAIMILGVGLVSLATLFPIGLLRLRDANRYTRSAFLTQTAAADATARGLLSSQSFTVADLLNAENGLPLWYPSAISLSGRYNPLTHDTAFYGADPFGAINPGVDATNTFSAQGGPGLPFAYDPLWRFQTVNTTKQFANGFVDVNGNPILRGGYYTGDPGALEARFGSGIGFIRNDPSGIGGTVPSAHGLQRITNFNRPYFINAANQQKPLMPVSVFVPNIFVGQEDVVWAEAVASNSTSPVLPDLSLPSSPGSPALDWRYSWMFTGQQTSASNSACFDGNIVIFENRPFGISAVANPPFNPAPFQAHQVAGETVVEAVYGYSTNVVPAGGPGYGAGADRTVLLRWPASIPDPLVRVGDWFADVTYERQQLVVYNPNLNPPAGRFLTGFPPAGYPNPTHLGEWDNLPPQRCFWYQIQKIVPPLPDPNVANHRSMTVSVNQSLQARTVLDANGNPLVLNAALIAPNVVNVIPQTIFVR
jgi:hypothetical protein